MSPLNRLFLSLLIILFYAACNKPSRLSGEEYKLASDRITALGVVPVNALNVDSVKQAWLAFGEDPFMKQDTALTARIKYGLARIYAMERNDSARIVIEQALKLIESTEDNPNYKALIYNGIGNVRSVDGKEREASYYFNKAAAIILSDPAVGASPELASSILLSAAQSNLQFFQYHLAEEMNRAALPLTDSLPNGHVNRQRVLAQMIHTLQARHASVDSAALYLQRLEALHAGSPDLYDEAHLYASKIKYFEMNQQTDSLLYYQLLKTPIDEHVFSDRQNGVEFSNLLTDYCNISLAYAALQEAPKAKVFKEKARLLINRHPELFFKDLEILFQKSLAALYALEGKKDAAIGIFRRIHVLQEEIYQSDNTKAVTEMNALYQLQVKDLAISALNERVVVNQLQLQQNRLWLALVALSTLLLGTLLFSLYYRFKRKRVSQEKEKLLLQQQLLRTQMEPHFIFNTLAAVQSFVRLDKKTEAINYLNRFSHLLRSSLELSRESRVPLEEEIAALNNYLCLQQMRFESSFAYEIMQPEDLETDIIMVPPMLIQPFVENAILHGVDLDAGNGKVEISLLLESDILRVSITDTGKGIAPSPDKLHRSLSGTITRERLSHLGKKATVQISNRPQGGTAVVLSIPVEYGIA